MPNILAQFQHDSENFFWCLQVSGAGDPVSDGLDGADKVLMHDTRSIRSICISPEFDAIDP